MIKPEDLGEPYEDKGKWCVDEQLYPEARGYNHHEFDTKAEAQLFINEVKEQGEPEPLHTGGPAFPQMYNGQSYNGMSMRDWLAGMALQGELACQSEESGEWPNDHLDRLAKRCYRVADEMLKVRGAK